ncbi:MAG: HD domain-containing protein [Clostridia bacterium]|nr:HD domain-containing protein [Clostridia bacterium]
MDKELLKQKFIEIYKKEITREGSDKLLEYLMSPACDFFEAPASTRFHGSYPGGLLEHSLNVYECLCDYVSRERAKEKYGMNFTAESLAISALLHDICKTNFYKLGTRNVKDENGRWVSVPSYTIEDKLPYGHGEKSVYIISGYMHLSRDEAFAIRYHMGFAGAAPDEKSIVGNAFEMFPLAFALSVADMEATYFVEGKENK